MTRPPIVGACPASDHWPYGGSAVGIGANDQPDSCGAGDRWNLIVIRDLMFGNRRTFAIC
jgi:hypothetical protein